MTTTPHVPIPVFDQVIVAVVAFVNGITVAFAATGLVAPRFRADYRRVRMIVGAVVAAGVFVLAIQTRATDRLFGGYFSSKSPRERLQDHFADFEEQVVRVPEIAAAIRPYSDASQALQTLASSGVHRLDDAALKNRAPLMAALFSELSDRTCAAVHKGAGATESMNLEIQGAMIKLGSKFVAAWMRVLYAQMLAEARKAPIPSITSADSAAALRALAAKIGEESTRRIQAGLQDGAPDAEYCRSVTSIYEYAPSLDDPHGPLLLRFVERWGVK